VPRVSYEARPRGLSAESVTGQGGSLGGGGEAQGQAGACLRLLCYLTQSVFKVVLHKSTPPQIRQLILYNY